MRVQAPYVFEEFVDKWGTLDILSKMELLFATARLALMRAPMTLPVLKKALFSGLKDADLAVADAARVIYHTFLSGIDTASTLLNDTDATTHPAAAEASETLLKQMLAEFNTLAVVHGQPAYTFVDRAAHNLRVVPPAPPVDTSGEDDIAEGDFMEDSAEAQLLDLGSGDFGEEGGMREVADDVAGGGLDDLVGASVATGIDSLDGPYDLKQASETSF
jgi:hypothetical protein